MIEISDEDMQEIHELITQINRHYDLVADDIRNLNNLIHVVKGEGIRFPEFQKVKYEP